MRNIAKEFELLFKKDILLSKQMDSISIDTSKNSVEDLNQEYKRKAYSHN